MDYELSRLSEASFEQLVQAIAVAEFGPAVQVYGAGPDGGREAVFQTNSYPASESGRIWSGRVVVQAKFVNVGDGTSNRAASFRNAVGAEMKAWRDPESKRSKVSRPKYLLFATNLNLTPFPVAGGLDSFYKSIRSASKGTGLQDVDVWHYPKICSLLDKHQGIRNAYLGSILPGDVLSELHEFLVGHTASTVEFFRASMASELAEERYMKLGEVGEAEDERLGLAQIFVDVPSRTDSDDDRGPKNDRRDVVARTLEAAELVSNSAGAKPLNAVVVGGPGQGKTTYGRYLAQIYRSTLLSSGVGSNSDRTVTHIDSLRASLNRLGLREPGHKRWPFRLVASDYAEVLSGNQEDQSIASFMLRRLNARSDAKIAIADLLRWLKDWPSILIVDGMDEAPLNLRPVIVRQVQRYRENALSMNADVAIVVTTRPQGDRTDFDRDEFDHWYLVPLEPAVARPYAHMLADLRLEDEPTEADRLKRGIDEALSNPATRFLMTTPLQVAILVLLLQRQSRVPRSRFGVFDAYFQTTFAREANKPDPIGRVLQEYREQILEIHERAGLILQMRGETAGDFSPRLLNDELRQLVADVLRKSGLTGSDEHLSSQITDLVTDRLVLLVSIHEGTWQFEVRSLQEYMAARAWTSGEFDLDRMAGLLDATASSNYWRNVWLLAAGRAFADGHSYRDRLYTVVTTQSTKELGHWLTPGAPLAADMLSDHVARGRPVYDRGLIKVALDTTKPGLGGLNGSLAEALRDRQGDSETYRVMRDDLRSIAKPDAGQGMLVFLRDLADGTGPLAAEARNLAAQVEPAGHPAQVFDKPTNENPTILCQVVSIARKATNWQQSRPDAVVALDLLEAAAEQDRKRHHDGPSDSLPAGVVAFTTSIEEIGEALSDARARESMDSLLDELSILESFDVRDEIIELLLYGEGGRPRGGAMRPLVADYLGELAV